MLRYEDLILRQEETIGAIASFLNVRQKGPFTADLGELRGMYPTIFRFGDNQMNIKELGMEEGLFHRLHGRTMKRLGYGSTTLPLFHRLGRTLATSTPIP